MQPTPAPFKNGCHNRPPLDDGRTYPVQDGWKDVTIQGRPTRIPVIRQQPNRMSPDCDYSKRVTDDKGCDGCKWRHTP